METKKMSEKESLAIIATMMQETREYFEKGSGNIMLLWGYLSAFVSIGIYIGWTLTQNIQVMWGWWLLPLIGFPGMLFLRKGQARHVKTLIGEMIGKVWSVIGICTLLIPLVNMFTGHIPILFLEVLLVNIGIAITGLMIRYKVIYLPGFAGIGISFLFLFVSWKVQILIFALLFIVLMVIPGHLLNRKAAKKQTESLC